LLYRAKESSVREMKTLIVTSSLLLIVLLIVSVVLVNVNADIIPIEKVDKNCIGKEVTVSGIITSLNSSFESDDVQTYEPGEVGILTLSNNDRTHSILICVNPRLWNGKFYRGQHIVVTGLYTGGILYADRVHAYIEEGYRDKKIKELSELYYMASVRIKGVVKKIEETMRETELTVSDGTGEIKIRYPGELKGIKLGEEVVVEGKYNGDKIYAFSIQKKPEPTATPAPTPSPSPSPSATPAPTPAPTPTPTPGAEEKEASHSIFYIIAGVMAVVIGLATALKLRERRMMEYYGAEEMEEMVMSRFFRDAFRYPLQRRANILIGGLLCLSGILVIPAFLIAGYLVRVTADTIVGSDKLPSWSDFGYLFKKGAGAFLIAVVYLFIPVMIIAIAFIYGSWYTSSTIAALISAAMGGLLLFFTGLLCTIAILRYADMGNIRDAFAIGAIFTELRYNIRGYFLAYSSLFGIWTVLGLLAFALSASIPVIGLLIGAIVEAFAGFYIAIAGVRIMGLVYNS